MSALTNSFFACTAAVCTVAMSQATVYPAPANEPATYEWSPHTGKLTITYNGTAIYSAQALTPDHKPVSLKVDTHRDGDKIAQTFTFHTESSIVLDGSVSTSPEGFAAETRGKAQEEFPLVRNSVGPSFSLRNNAIYDRRFDWSLVATGTEGVHIEPTKTGHFNLGGFGTDVTLTFYPRYYQKQKNLPHYEPWTYQVRKDSITGWCSWWAYFDKFKETDLKEVLNVLSANRLNDFGYRFVQIDDCYQDRSLEGRPESWLKWNSNFPSGIDGYASAVRAHGFEPAVWSGVQFWGEQTPKQHPDWFVKDATGNPMKAPWIDYVTDASNPDAAKNLVAPRFAGFKKAGFTYAKLDTLRHLMYDGLNNAPDWLAKTGKKPDDVFRAYLETARAALGKDTFLLACWGVLPEAIGIADGCRIGGDGFGVRTFQQYNSWNGVIWRNDPDHCDVGPNPIMRPVLASLAGSMLMLSDKASVYQNPANLEGAKRAAPVLYTVPGQLYDYEPTKSDVIAHGDRRAIKTGSGDSPVDATQKGPVCPWWLLEIAKSYEHWNILARMNFGDTALPTTKVYFGDLGLKHNRDYILYEFWSKTYLGVRKGSFQDEVLEPGKMRLWSIREKLDHPQILSTSRHISQGGLDLEDVKWDEKKRELTATASVIQGDPYEIVVRMPALFRLNTATGDGNLLDIKREEEISRVTLHPTATGPVHLTLKFSKE